ncbi:MAG TPA: hypothetical protein VIZ18_00660, partial [Ktedonobacteraceae bacterium]
MVKCEQEGVHFTSLVGDNLVMQKQTGTIQVKRNFPEMLKGGVICDVVNADQARIAED